MRTPTVYYLLLTAFCLASCQRYYYVDNIESTKLCITDSLGVEKIVDDYHVIIITEDEININDQTYKIYDKRIGINTIQYIPYNTPFYFVYMPSRGLHEVAYYDNCVNKTYLVKSFKSISAGGP